MKSSWWWTNSTTWRCHVSLSSSDGELAARLRAAGGTCNQWHLEIVFQKDATLVSVELIDVSLTEISEQLATICSAVLSAASLCVFGFLRIPSLSARALALWNRGPIFAHCNFLGTCGNLSTATCWFGRPAKPLVAHETCGTLQIWHVWAVLNRLVLSERNLALPWR